MSRQDIKNIIQDPQPRDTILGTDRLLWGSEGPNRFNERLQILQPFVMEQSSQKKVVLRVMTWNVHGFKDGGAKGVETVIREINPDIVALQEYPDHSQLILSEVYRYNTRCMTTERLSNVLLSRYPIVYSETIVLAGQRCATLNDVQLPDGGGVPIVNVHLAPVRQDQRITSVIQILEKVVADDVLLLGDLNSYRKADYEEADLKELSSLKSRFGWPNIFEVPELLEEKGFVDSFNLHAQTVASEKGSDIRSFPPKNTTRFGGRVDFVYIKGKKYSRVLGSYVYFTNQSDHLPVVVDLAPAESPSPDPDILRRYYTKQYVTMAKEHGRARVLSHFKPINQFGKIWSLGGTADNILGAYKRTYYAILNRTIAVHTIGGQPGSPSEFRKMYITDVSQRRHDCEVNFLIKYASRKGIADREDIPILFAIISFYSKVKTLPTEREITEIATISAKEFFYGDRRLGKREYRPYPNEKVLPSLLYYLSQLSGENLDEMLHGMDDYSRKCTATPSLTREIIGHIIDAYILNTFILSVPRHDSEVVVYRRLARVQTYLKNYYLENLQVGKILPVFHFQSTGKVPVDSWDKDEEVEIVFRIRLPAYFPYYVMETSTNLEHSEVILPYTTDPTGRHLTYGYKVLKHETKRSDIYKVIEESSTGLAPEISRELPIAQCADQRIPWLIPHRTKLHKVCVRHFFTVTVAPLETLIPFDHFPDLTSPKILNPEEIDLKKVALTSFSDENIVAVANSIKRPTDYDAVSEFLGLTKEERESFLANDPIENVKRIVRRYTDKYHR